jgi:diguanylate cyclase (GGDEF)-like protein/PAS domain S-box-containing protein
VDGNWNAWMVLVSIAIAVMASYVALDLAARVSASPPRESRLWLAAGAVCMGVGIWSMHFVGMLALRLPMAMHYDVPTTGASLLIAIVVSGFALHTAGRAHLGLVRLGVGAVLMGLGIAAMHYVGMAAMRMEGTIHYAPGLVLASVLVAIGASFGALWLAFRLREHTLPTAPWRRSGSAVVMGAAICGMHYTGMAAAIFPAHDAALGMAQAGSAAPDIWLAVLVSVFAFMLLAATLLVSLFDVNRGRSEARSTTLAASNDALQRATDALAREREFISALLDNISEGIVACDDQGTLTLFNPATRAFHGLPMESLPAQDWPKHYSLFDADGTTPLATSETPLYRAFAGELVHGVEMVIAPNDLPRRTVVCNGRALLDREGRKLGAVVAMHDITERKHAEQQLKQLAHFDPLTGLPNRRQFQESLTNATALAGAQGWQVAVLFVDLDNFKDINDTLGHAVGDDLLRQVSQRLLGCLRVRDTVGRLGGDEFGIVLLAQEDAQGLALRVAAKLHAALRAPFVLEGHVATCTASIGMTAFPADATDAPSLVRYADLAMYEAKQAGRDQHRFYTEAMNLRAREKLALESALRDALARQEFELHYQPKLSLATGAWVGVEALLRWNRPGHGQVAPAEFIPSLEATGLIVAVGAWVVDAACRQARAWRDAGLPPLPIAVNLSPQQLAGRRPFARGPGATLDGVGVELPMLVADCLLRHGVPGSQLEFEITENALIADADAAADILRRLKDLGIRISLDDFGTGYSGLTYLRRFRLDAIKIDGSFVRGLGSDGEDTSIIVAMIELARQLGLDVVAECVESQAQLDLLQSHGCQQAQGFRIARPMPATEMTSLWRGMAATPQPMEAGSAMPEPTTPEPIAPEPDEAG